MVPSPIQPRRKTGNSAWGAGVLLAGVLLSFPSVAWGDPNTDLMDSAATGDPAGVKAALTAGADVNAQEDVAQYKMTALMEAAIHGNLPIVRILLDHGADVNALSSGGGTALGGAINFENVSIVRLLLDRGASINIQSDTGMTNLMGAVLRGNIQIVHILLNHGADINARNNLGFTALDYAKKTTHPDIVSLIQDYVRQQNQAHSRQPSTGSPGISSKEARQIADRAAQKATEETRARDDKKIKELKDQIRPKSQSGSSDAKMQEILVLIKSLQKKKNSLPAPPTYHSPVDRPSFHRPENRNLYAVVIGVEHYPKPLPAATFADRDAQAIRSTLLALGVPPDHLKTLTDDTASRSRIKGAFSWLRRNVRPGSTVWVYFSGHGSPSDKGTAYLVPFDGDPTDLSDTGYRVSDFYRQLDRLPAKRIIVALDACFTGEGSRSVVGPVRPLVTKIRTGSFPLSGKVIAFSAAKADQESGVLESQGHGLFTYYFLKGLDQGAVRNGHVTVSRLYAYVKRKVERKASLDNRTQVPELEPATLGKDSRIPIR